MHHLTPFDVNERIVSRSETFSPVHHTPACEGTGGQTPHNTGRREISEDFDLLIWPCKGNPSVEHGSVKHINRDLITAFSPGPTASEDWQDAHDLPAMLQTPEAPRRLSALFCSAEQRRLSLGPFSEPHETSQAKQQTSQKAICLVHQPDSSTNVLSGHSAAVTNQQHAPSTNAIAANRQITCIPAGRAHLSQANNNAYTLPKGIAHRQGVLPTHTAGHRVANYRIPEPNLAPQSASTQQASRSVPAPEQLAVLHNASSWLREYGLAADSRTAKLLFQYLAHQDLTFEQVSASQLAEAVQQLSQHRDANVQQAVAYCLAKWQLLKPQG